MRAFFLCYLKPFRCRERRYLITEKESLGLVWACERFHLYLYDMAFEMVTIHKPLEATHTPKSKPCTRIEILQTYNFKVMHKLVSQNIIESLSKLMAIVKTQKRNEAEDYVKFVAQAALPFVALMAQHVEYA